MSLYTHKCNYNCSAHGPVVRMLTFFSLLPSFRPLHLLTVSFSLSFKWTLVREREKCKGTVLLVHMLRSIVAITCFVEWGGGREREREGERERGKVYSHCPYPPVMASLLRVLSPCMLCSLVSSTSMCSVCSKWLQCSILSLSPSLRHYSGRLATLRRVDLVYPQCELLFLFAIHSTPVNSAVDACYTCQLYSL